MYLNETAMKEKTKKKEKEEWNLWPGSLPNTRNQEDFMFVSTVIILWYV